MPSLRELQQGFADAVLGPPGTPPPFGVVPSALGAARIAVYRTALFANYRNALSATYPVVKRLTGAAFFHTAVDAFVRAHPSRSGDLNIYGDRFGDFLVTYAPAAELPYLPDVARLEWAIDEAQRAPDGMRAPDAVLAALSAMSAESLPGVRLGLDASCRLLTSAYPILRIWQVNQADHVGEDRVTLDQGADRILVRRDAQRAALERLPIGDFAWLEALARALPLASAIDAAQSADANFDLGTALRTHIATGTIAAVVPG